MVLGNILGKNRYWSLLVYDGFLPGDFQKTVQIVLQFERCFGCGYVEIRLISDVVDMDWERDFVELVDKVVDFLLSCSF